MRIRGGIEDPTGTVQHLAQVVGGGLRSKIWPQEVHRLLAVETVVRREGKQLHQGSSLPQMPSIPFYGARPDGDSEATE